MSTLPQALVQDLPSYISMIDFNVSRETSEQSINKLINKINDYNGGND